MQVSKLNIKEVLALHNNCNVLIPSTQNSIDEFKKIPVNSRIVMSYELYRNLKLHRKFFAILKNVCENFNVGVDDPYTLLKMIQSEMGIVEKFKFRDKEYIIPKSIAFAKMGNKEFEDIVYNPILNFLASYLQVSKDKIEKGFEEYL